jgi:predicted phage-related endonuclease
MAARNPDRVSLAKLAEDIAKARKLEAQIARLKTQLTPITAALKAAMGDATTGHINGKPVFTQAITTRETVDTKNLRLEQPEIAAKYLKTATVRTYRLEPEA